MTEKNEQSEAGLASDLNRELEALRLNDEMTHEQRAKMKWAYIVEQNDKLTLENTALKLWLGSLLAADGFDNGCYDAQNLRIARDKLKEILDNPINSIILENEKWYWVRLESFGNVVEASAMYLDAAKCFYSYRFGGIPVRELTVLRSV